MKKFLVLVIVICLSLGLVACNDNSLDTQNNTPNTDDLERETGNTVLGSYNGVDITRDDVGENLYNAEFNILASYLYQQIWEDFYINEKGISVSDEQIELNFQLVKEQIGEDNWDMYLYYYANGSEDVLRDNVKRATVEEDYISQRREVIRESITDDELQKIYDEDQDANNILVLDCIPLNDEEELESVKAMIDEGKTLEEIAESLEIEVLKERYAYYADGESTEWSVDLHTANVGDLVYTSADSGTLLVGKIVSLNTGLDNELVKTTLLDNESYARAQEEVSAEFDEFLKTKKVTIFEVEMTAYDLLMSGDTDDTTE